MRDNGLEACIQRYAWRVALCWESCGGYQMLGMTIRDPEGVEGGGAMEGMGLLPVDTVYATRKGADSCSAGDSQGFFRS